MVKALQLLANLQFWLVDTDNRGVFVQTTVESSLVEEDKEQQYEDTELVLLRGNIVSQENLFDCEPTGILRCHSRLNVPNVSRLQDQIMSEAHYSWYSTTSRFYEWNFYILS